MQMASKRSATRSETSQIDSAMARDVPGHPHAPTVNDRSAGRHSRVNCNPTQKNPKSRYGCRLWSTSKDPADQIQFYVIKLRRIPAPTRVKAKLSLEALPETIH